MSFSSSKRRTASSKAVCLEEQGEGIELELETREPRRLSTSKHSIADSARCSAVDFTNQDDAVICVEDYAGHRDELDSPTIVNNTKYPIVVFLARGILYNKRVLHPGEAFTLTRKQTGGYNLKLPYRVHAVIGDEEALPTTTDSLKNLAKISAVPLAFVGGCLATATAAGTLTGPTLALAPLVSGMVVKGVVIDTAALASGAVAADMAKKVASKLLENHKEKLMGVTGILLPGKKYLSVTGGLFEGPIKIETVSRYMFSQMEITAMKVPEKTRTKNSKRKSVTNETENEPIIIS